ACHQEAVLAVLRARGEHLGAADDPLVAVEDRPGTGAGEVGAAVRLGVPEADADLAAGNTRHDVGLQPLVALGAAGAQRQRGGALGDARRVPAAQLVLQETAAQRVQPGAPLGYRPIRKYPALFAERAMEGAVVPGAGLPLLLDDAGREVLVEKLLDLPHEVL